MEDSAKMVLNCCAKHSCCVAPVAGLKLRRMASSEQQRGAKESTQAAQAAELQALFLRRQSGMGMKAGNKRPV